MNMKKTASLLLSAALCLGAAAGCGGGDTPTPAGSSPAASGLTLPADGGYKTVSITPSADKYRTFYEIFPYSFCDSDGNGIGDFKGITSKLDYLNDGNAETTDDLGIEGIWLMPIMPSPSYHKYNVTDYMAVDEAYGTMDDFKTLVSESHKRGINVIIDFVINHTSRKHEWYQKALEELKAGKTDGYAEYYHFEKDKKDTKGWKDAGIGGGWYYECEFDEDMPDVNLKSEKVREEYKKIVDFWLKDIGLDGFRLDAVLWYESTSIQDSVEDLKWLYDYAKTVKSDVYMVGECWSSSGNIAEFYQSGADSFFNFDMEGVNGQVVSTINTKYAKGYAEYLQNWQELIRKNNAAAIDAPFISNHDTSRSASFFKNNTTRKMAASLYLMAPGNPFIYYGEEIGMTGSGDDPNKRTGMYWSSTDTTGYVAKIPGSVGVTKPETGVAQQQTDENSLLSFYKRAIRLRSQNPELARGTLKAVDLGKDSVSGFVTEYEDSKVMVIFNVGTTAETVTVPSTAMEIKEVRGYLLCDSGDVSAAADVDPFADLTGGDTKTTSETSAAADVKEPSVVGAQVTMPAYSVIVLK